jgi:hypothetical protein
MPAEPIRVVVHTAMYPVLSESYITEDIDALELAGATVTVTAVLDAASRTKEGRSARLDFDAAITEARPDVALMHWTDHAESELGTMERHRVPFAARVHSFDADPDRVRRLLDHPLCIGVLSHPSQVADLPAGVRGLLPTVSQRTAIPASPAERQMVVSVSAGLAKKNFPLLIDAMGALPEVERQIIVARTNGEEQVPAEVQGMAEEVDPAIKVRIDVPRHEVLDTVAGGSVLLYTVFPEARMGHPMSVVEAMLCGTIPVLPDRPESRVLFGPDVRVYRDAADIVGHVREVNRGGPSIEAERQALRDTATRYTDPAALAALHQALHSGLEEWRVRQAG